MTGTPRPDEHAAAETTRGLARLREQTEAARAELAALQIGLIEARALLGSSQSSRLLEANEQLVLSLLRAQADAEVSARAFRDASRLAECDPLTGLPNRVLLLDRLIRAIAAAKRHGIRAAVLCIDISNFGRVNDALGHAIGDQVLQHVASSLLSLVRDADTVSRHGADEFLVVLTEMSQGSDAAGVASKVIAALGAACRIGAHELRLAASIGISVFPDDGDHAETLIDRADAAMVHAKRNELGVVFHGELPAAGPHRRSPPPGPLPHAVGIYESALVENDQRHSLLREANEHLLLAALDAQQLQAAAEQAQCQQMHFLAVLAHELRNPLAPIRTAAALLAQVGSDELPRMQAIIERQVAHMARLVGDLLDVSRANTGKLRLERRPMDLSGILDEVVDACRPAMVTRLQHFTIEVPAGALSVHGDADRLAQVFSNLLDNASKYTPVGGRIGLLARIVDQTILATVSDSGIGITEAALPHVFDPFVQDTHAIGFNGAGLGIGLTVVRELVEAHGGTVVAASAGTGLGSEFVVTLPLLGLPTLVTGKVTA